MKKILIKGKKIVGGVAEGVAFVKDGFDGIDISEDEASENPEKSGYGNIVVCTQVTGISGFGGEAGMLSRETLPKALIISGSDQKTILDAILMDIPSIAGLEKNPLEIISTGDWVRVNADNGQVIVFKE